jgi:tripartite-type tricarboxylate transporter receptor subunit TctC
MNNETQLSGWNSISRRVFTTGALASIALPRRVSAQTYPTRTIQIINPNAPGGVNDVVARLLAQRLQDRLGKPAIVENRPGAGGDLGVSAVAKSDPDGHSLVIVSTSVSMKPAVSRKISYDITSDLTPVARLVTQPHVLVVRPSLGVKSLREFIELAKANPNKFTYGSSGYGTPQHLGAELFCAEAGIKMVHVPYKGAVLAMTDVMSGQIDMFYATETSGAPHMAAGKLHPLAVTGRTRTANLPNVPTVAELGYPKATLVAWYGILGPAKMPQDVTNLLANEFKAMSETKEYSERMGQLFLDISVSTPEEFRSQIVSEIAFWKEAAQSAGIQPED